MDAQVLSWQLLLRKSTSLLTDSTKIAGIVDLPQDMKNSSISALGAPEYISEPYAEVCTVVSGWFVAFVDVLIVVTCAMLIQDELARGWRGFKTWKTVLLKHPQSALRAIWLGFWNSWIAVLTVLTIMYGFGMAPALTGYGLSRGLFILANILLFVRCCVAEELHGKKAARKVVWERVSIIVIVFLSLSVLSLVECGMVNNAERNKPGTLKNIWAASLWWHHPEEHPLPGAVMVSTRGLFNYIWIPPGTFKMGCSPGDTECWPEENPLHSVTLSKGFWIAQTEVTVAAYKRSMGARGQKMPASPWFNRDWTDGNQPMVNVTWGAAQAYCVWTDGRLPSEAEWEYAARGGSTAARYGNIDDIAWYHENSGRMAHDVAHKCANGFGLYDMLGNAWEWVGDWYDENYYRKSPVSDPPGSSSGNERVVRGGSWLNRAGLSRLSNRNREDPDVAHPYFGFRCAKDED